MTAPQNLRDFHVAELQDLWPAGDHPARREALDGIRRADKHMSGHAERSENLEAVG